MLNNTLVVLVSGTTVSLWDKFLKKEKFSKNLGTTIYDMVYDRQRSKVWVYFTSKVQRYSVTDTDMTLDVEYVITTSYNYSDSMCINPKTGDCYYVEPLLGVTASKLVKFEYGDGTTNTFKTLALPVCSTWFGINWNQPGVSLNPSQRLVFNQKEEKIYVSFAWSCGGVFNVNPTFLISVDKGLTTYDYTTHKAKNINLYNYYSYFNANRLTAQMQSMVCYNNVTNTMVIGRDLTSVNTLPSVFLYSTENKNYKYASLGTTANMNGVFFAESTGNIHVVTEDKKVCVYNTTMTALLYEYNVIGNTQHITFNNITEDLYIVDPASQYITGFTKTGDIFAQSPLNAGKIPFVPTRFYTFAGLNEVISSGVTAPTIVQPDQYVPVVDTTPTIVFKVGKSNAGWTQQFRVVIDTDENKIINQGFNDSYTYVLDSWANGGHYVNAAWEYSTDYDEALPDPYNGTWNTLGTTESLQKGGVMPTNGVVCENTGDVYVKLTLPAGYELTGADINQKWLFKVYSYSKYVG